MMTYILSLLYLQSFLLDVVVVIARKQKHVFNKNFDLFCLALNNAIDYKLYSSI